MLVHSGFQRPDTASLLTCTALPVIEVACNSGCHRAHDSPTAQLAGFQCQGFTQVDDTTVNHPVHTALGHSVANPF